MNELTWIFLRTGGESHDALNPTKLFQDLNVLGKSYLESNASSSGSPK